MCKCCGWEPPAEGALTSLCVSARMESQERSVHEQSPNRDGVGGERDSGYDSLRRRMSVLDRLSLTHPAWLLLTVSAEEATHILLQQPPGVNNYDLLPKYTLADALDDLHGTNLDLIPFSGVTGEEGSCCAEEGSFCTCGKGPGRKCRQSLSCQREPVQ